MDKFSIRWTGKVEAPVSGAYTFVTRSDDGVRLWVNGKLLINNWTNHGATYDQAVPIQLTAGQKYDIQLDYYENTGNTVIELSWSYPNQTRQVIPTARLYPTPGVVIPPPAATSRLWLSDVTWLRASNGHGPVELDKSNGESAANDGRTMSIGGLRWSSGLGVHSQSEITYLLADRFDTFKATIGMDDEVGDRGSVVFEVWADGTLKYRSAKMTGVTPALAIEVPVENVRELKLIVTDGGDGIAYDHANWANAYFEGVETIKYMSSLNWMSDSVNGLGPAEKDRANGTAEAKDGATIKIRGIEHSRGIGTYAYSQLAFDLDKKYERFSSVVGIDDSSRGAGSVVFEVYGDGTRLYQSPVLRGNSPPQMVSINISNVDILLLRVLDGNDGTTGDFGDWASAQLLPKGTDSPIPVIPSGLSATAGDRRVTLNWTATPNAVSYKVYRSTTAGSEGSVIASEVLATTYTSTGLTNGTQYFFKVRAQNGAGISGFTPEVSATPAPPPPPGAPTNLTATPSLSKVALSWTGVSGATSYRVFRGLASNGQSTTAIGSVSGTTYNDTSVTNGTRYFYKVAAVGTGGQGPMSNEANAIPMSLPAAPTNVTITSGNQQITISWGAVTGAATYNLYRGTTAGGQGTAAYRTGLTATTFTDTGVTNGTNYYYKVTALNVAGESSRSAEVTAAPTSPQPAPDPATISAWRLLRRATWGPKPGEVDRVKQIGATAFLNEQFAAPMSVYPDTLYDQSVEWTQEHFMQLALTGPDQLRQRVAWALHKIWVVSAVEVDKARAIVNYQRVLMNRAFGNYRQLMSDMTYNPAMGRYLNMLNNRSQSVTGQLPNENYARELLQLFTTGIPILNQAGVPQTNAQGQQLLVYTEDDVKELARIFTGFTFGDGNPSTLPNNLQAENYTVPMEPVERYHDVGAKTFLGVSFPAQSAAPGVARGEVERALDLIFIHPNVPPFVSRQLIQMLVRSNPSTQYVSDVAATFINNGSGVRGDLQAVVRRILTHPESQITSATGDKLMEPALFVLSQARSLNATVADHPFMTDLAEEMGQKVFYPPSVFSYFSPGYRIRGTTVNAPEFMGLTSVTSLTRTNFVGRLLGNQFGADVTIDYAPFTSRAADPAGLVDYASLLLLGGQMSAQQRQEIINAVQVTPATNTTERVRTALYLVLTSAQYQVDR